VVVLVGRLERVLGVALVDGAQPDVAVCRGGHLVRELAAAVAQAPVGGTPEPAVDLALALGLAALERLRVGVLERVVDLFAAPAWVRAPERGLEASRASAVGNPGDVSLGELRGTLPDW